MSWVCRGCVVVAVLVVGLMGEEKTKLPWGWETKEYKDQGAKLAPMLSQAESMMYVGGAAGGAALLAFLVVCGSLLCLVVLETKVERDRARFLDTRIAQFVDKPGAGDLGEEDTADEMEEDGEGGNKSDGIPKTTTAELEAFDKEKQKYEKDKDSPV